MVLYIHGFASSGRGSKAKSVRDYFKESIAPSLSYIPELAVDSLRQIIEHSLQKGERVNLMGSSLGGYYAIYLSERYNLPAVLINPSIKPYETLAAYTGRVTNFYDLSSFEWKDTHIEQLRRLDIKEISRPENFLLMLQKGDELLDYKIALKRVKGAKVILEEGGSHAFDRFERHLAKIETFFKSKEIDCKSS